MSASDGTVRGAARGRSTSRLIIRRDDHVGDALGFAFLEAASGDHETIIDRLREYLGPRIKIVRAEASAEQIEIEVSVRRLAEEATRLALAADALSHKGARRNAQSLFKEALELDPLNVAALRGMATLLAAREDWTGALRTLCRAREAGGESAELLHELGRVAAASERTAAAVAYLERACELAPDNFAIRRTLADLGRKPRATRQARARATANPGRTRDNAR
ncbi:MAG TPA: tetratricopeptide repeat protein [Candidatus Binataceae bacterium]|nr:tetratricopeptide repeat protein [Candidatus Binataceae bacterium]